MTEQLAKHDDMANIGVNTDASMQSGNLKTNLRPDVCLCVSDSAADTGACTSSSGNGSGNGNSGSGSPSNISSGTRSLRDSESKAEIPKDFEIFQDDENKVQS